MLIKNIPEPYRSMALANQKLQGNPSDKNIKLIYGSECEGFSWNASKEGADFWVSVNRGGTPELTPEIKANYPEIFKQVELTCMGCGETFYGDVPKMCCSGRDCGCMGMPIDPILCSPECYELMKLKVKKGAKTIIATPSPVITEGGEAGEQNERFKMPTDDQLIKTAILFNDGKLEHEKLADMVGMCEFVLNRLYENGDMQTPASKENE